MLQHRTTSEQGRRDTLWHICQKGMAEPARIWELLESKGIQVTPGIHYQAITDHPEKLTDEARGTITAWAGEQGLSVEDVEMVASLANKAGGVRQFIRLLSTMQRVLR